MAEATSCTSSWSSPRLRKRSTLDLRRWGDHYDSRLASLRDIPNHVEVKKGEKVFTSGYSLFPAGIAIGEVSEVGAGNGESFLDITIALSTEFHNLQHVYVVMDHYDVEKQELEANPGTDD